MNTGEALNALAVAGCLGAPEVKALYGAWTLQQDLQQVLKVALAEDADPREEPARFRTILAKAGGSSSFLALETKLDKARRAAHKAFSKVVTG